MLKPHLRRLCLRIFAVSFLTITGCEESTETQPENKANRRSHLRDNDTRLGHAKKITTPPISNGMSSFAQYRAERERKLKEAELKQEKLQIAKITFTTDHPPEGVTIEGLSSPEAWGGTWSVGKKVAIHFEKPLPAEFKLSITGRAYGPNAEKPFTLLLGSHKEIMMFRASGNTRSIQVRLEKPVDTLTILIPQPTSPKEMNESADVRELGIGLTQILVLHPNLVPTTPLQTPPVHLNSPNTKAQ